MLSLETPTLGKCCDVSAFKFWHLRISKTFDKPEYFIGQTVLHRINVRQGEILHPVEVIGLFWDGMAWIYMIDFPPDHPMFKPEDSELAEVGKHQLEPI